MRLADSALVDTTAVLKLFFISSGTFFIFTSLKGIEGDMKKKGHTLSGKNFDLAEIEAHRTGETEMPSEALEKPDIKKISTICERNFS